MILTSGELSILRGEYDRSLSDDCTLYTYVSGTVSTDGQEIAVYSTGTVDCGFKPTRAFTNYLGQLIIPSYQAELRLSLTTPVFGKDIIGFGGKLYTIEGINAGMVGKIAFLQDLDI